jgi:hypothetical protein
VKRNKYGAVKTTYDGVKYDSKKEAGYAAKLDQLKRCFNASEKVIGVRRQVPFPIVVEGKHICTYKLDFLVTYADGRIEHVDVKGVRTGVYIIKKKCVEAIYKIEIIEV